MGEETYHGHHRLWHVLDPGGERRAKLAEPRVPQIWFDPRCFDSEEILVAELAALGMDRVPAVRLLDPSPSGERHTPMVVQDFTEGRTLAEVVGRQAAVPEEHLAQIMERFRQLASVRPQQIRTPRRCKREDRVEDRDAPAFLRTLIAFTRSQVHLRWRTQYPALFHALGIPPDALAPGSPLDLEAELLTRRPFCLIHGDLHRANFIVDATDGRLWTIDWELAMIGDPLYDLATHLHLMSYPPWQEDEVVARWRETVPQVLVDADVGIEEDLPRYRAYKCAQSVFIDVVRQAHRVLAASREERTAQLRASGEVVSALLRRAASILKIGRAPSPREATNILCGLPAPQQRSGLQRVNVQHSTTPSAEERSLAP